VARRMIKEFGLRPLAELILGWSLYLLLLSAHCYLNQKAPCDGCWT
jgi:hypothetical protein